MIGAAVYLLCILTSTSCSWLLLRMYRWSRTRLLIWSARSFAGWAISNTLVFADFIIVPETDLSLLRVATALGATCLLLFGLVWDQQ